MFKPVQWVTRTAATGLRDLPSNTAWLASRTLAAPSAVARAATTGITANVRRMAEAAADHLPGARDTVEARLRQAQAAVASARQAESDALATAQHVKELAEGAKQSADEGQARVRQALQDAHQEVDRRMRAARVRFAQLLDRERQKAGRETAAVVQRVTAQVRSTVDKSRGVAQAAAELAQEQIHNAAQQMAAARSLAAQAAAAAERLANEAREQARTMTGHAPAATSTGDGVTGDSAADLAYRSEQTVTGQTTRVVVVEPE